MSRANLSAKELRTSRGSPRMFESALLERFSHVHPAVPAALYLPVVAFSVFTAVVYSGLPIWRVGLELVFGYLIWTLFEYWLHRLFFHLPVVGPKTRSIYFFVHGVHHEYPWDETRLVIPPGASLLLCALTYIAFRAALGPDLLFGPFAGFVLGYVLYDSIHWYVHARAPRTRFGRWLRREHMIHHFKEPTSRFGVSCPWLDSVFGTRGQQPRRASEEEQEQDSSQTNLPVAG